MASLHDVPLFPLLHPSNNRITGDSADEYNCVAWAFGYQFGWFYPGQKWPVPVDVPGTPDTHINALQHFLALGFSPCSRPDQYRAGYITLALYAREGVFRHVSRLLPSGRWTSKLGLLYRISHSTPEVLTGGYYGTVYGYLCGKRGVLYV